MEEERSIETRVYVVPHLPFPEPAKPARLMQRELSMYPALGTRTVHAPPEMAAPTSPTHT